MIEKKKERRIRDQINKKNKVKKYIIYKDNPDTAIRNANHPKACSCSICGNVRKFFDEVTTQEKKSEINFSEEINEVRFETRIDSNSDNLT